MVCGHKPLKFIFPSITNDNFVENTCWGLSWTLFFHDLFGIGQSLPGFHTLPWKVRCYSDGPTFVCDLISHTAFSIFSLFYTFSLLTTIWYGNFLFWSCILGVLYASCIWQASLFLDLGTFLQIYFNFCAFDPGFFCLLCQLTGLTFLQGAEVLHIPFLAYFRFDIFFDGVAHFPKLVFKTW